MNLPILLLVAVFVLGFAMGALLVSIQRRAQMGTIKAVFEAELRALASREATPGDPPAARQQVEDGQEIRSTGPRAA